MPELPDVSIYVERLRARVLGELLQRVHVWSPFVLRTVAPPPRVLEGCVVCDIRRIGKQIAFSFDHDLHLVVHLMIAGRFHWKPPGKRLGRRPGLAAFEFPTGLLLLTEVSTRKRAALHVVQGAEALAGFDRGGLEVLDADIGAFRAALVAENHTLKRALTDPRLFAGIGNAYSDEILHRARLSPLRLTRQLDAVEIQRLHVSVVVTLQEWTDRLRAQTGDGFPEKVTAFRPEMAVHGRYGKACPVCGAIVQRIAYAESECNYCPECQTEGRLLADRSLSRLLHDDWPRTWEELEERRGRLQRSSNAEGADPAPPADAR